MSTDIFKGVSSIGDSTVTERLQINLFYYLDWAFLNIGAYFNVNRPQSGVFGGDESQLRPVSDPYYTDGQVWESFRSSWVWESGISQGTQPIQFSGVYVDDVLNLTTDGGFFVDYPNGRVIFDTAQNTSATIEAEYSFKWIHMYNGDDVPWFRETQYDSQKIDTNKFFISDSGDLSVLGKNRLQLPAIIIEMTEGATQPHSLGGGQKILNDVVFHVMAQDGNTVDKISDIIVKQSEKTIFGFNPDLVADSGTFPLDFRGMLQDGAKTFDQLVVATDDGGFRWQKIRLYDVRKQSKQIVNQELYIRPIRMSTEVIVGFI